jgi:hypothetical protein
MNTVFLSAVGWAEQREAQHNRSDALGLRKPQNKLDFNVFKIRKFTY